MIVKCRWLALALCAFGASALAADRPQQPLPGTYFQSRATQDMQADDTANPAMLWVEQGAALFRAPGASGKSCASCHAVEAEPFKSAATRFPRVSADGSTLLNLEARINLCRRDHQSAPPLPYESDALLGLTAYLAMQARGLPRSIAIDGPAQPFFERGRTFWQTRQGQLNLACAQCHDDNVGKKLRGDTVSQGQSHGWPAYRMEWQTIGSLHRRLRACSLGVRAEVLPYASPDYLALELFLAWRGGTLPLESPAVRR